MQQVTHALESQKSRSTMSHVHWRNFSLRCSKLHIHWNHRSLEVRHMQALHWRNFSLRCSKSHIHWKNIGLQFPFCSSGGHICSVILKLVTDRFPLEHSVSFALIVLQIFLCFTALCRFYDPQKQLRSILNCSTEIQTKKKKKKKKRKKASSDSISDLLKDYRPAKTIGHFRSIIEVHSRCEDQLSSIRWLCHY